MVSKEDGGLDDIVVDSSWLARDSHIYSQLDESVIDLTIFAKYLSSTQFLALYQK